MARKQHLWLFIWIFIFFVFFCIWSKLQYHTPKISAHAPTTQVTVQHQKEMHFKALKDKDSVTLSGIVASQEAKDRLIDAYGKVFQEVNHTALSVNQNVKQDKLFDFFTNFADIFSHFESGYLAYSDGLMEIDGVTSYDITQQSLEEEINKLKEIKVDNTLFIAPKVSQKRNKRDTNQTEKVAFRTTVDIQNSLNKILNNRRVQFLYAKEILTDESKALIDKIVALLEENSQINLEIAGHTDSYGTKKTNMRLSKLRADSVKKYMIEKKIDGKRLHTVGYGESRPLVPNNTHKNRQINRRVEFKVIGE